MKADVPYSPPTDGGNQSKVLGRAVNALGEAPPAGSIPAPPTKEYLIAQLEALL